MKDIPSYFKYWGKAIKIDSSDNKDEYHLLVYHSLDVAAVADVWLELSNTILSQIAKHLNLPPREAKQICLFFILLHDLGKFDARFQNFREDIRQKLQGDDLEIDPDLIYYSHGSCGYKQFCKMFDTNEAMKAVAGHHGYCDTSINYYDPDADDELIDLDERARKEWVEFCLTFCQLDVIPDVGEIPMLAGLCSVSDWIGSSITNFTKKPILDLHQYYANIKPKAQKALKATGMVEELKGAGFNYLFKEYKPRGIQKLLNNLPLQAGLTLVESDTGSGKTEFALSYASLLIKEGLADGVVFGLPTQATANGLFARIGDATAKLFPDTQATLSHGKAKYIITNETDENGFLHYSNKRAFLGAMSVATVDQILMGVLSVKHQFVRSFGTRKSVLILDEIHSYDSYMMGLIEQVLKGQHQAYSSVILLSATLPNQLKEKLLTPYNGYSSSSSYPLISHTNLFGKTNEYTLFEQPAKKTVKIDCWFSEDVLPNYKQIEQIMNWVLQGAMVGIICNTVKDAQRLYKKIKRIEPSMNVDLFHARYTFEDRKNLENMVLNKYGKKAKRNGSLLIATQVVEQSLDLDFDVLVSQIAPIEFLMQRMGRLWRHNRYNTDLCLRTSKIKEPLFITLLPNQKITQNLSTDKLKQHYQQSGYVYKNIRLLYRTEQYLSVRIKIEFPSCYREAIDYVHYENPYSGEFNALTSLAEEFSMTAEGNNYTARCLSKLQSQPLSDVDSRCALLTRDGEMSETVVIFKGSGELLYGGDFNEQEDRERSSVSLAPRYAKGQRDEKYYCYKAVIAKDIIYNEMGVVSSDLIEELRAGS